MLRSMTGYGKALCEYNSRNITIEIKSLNSKQIDINTKLPLYYKEKEIEIRNILKSLIRGKIEFSISVDGEENSKRVKINGPLIKEYFKQIQEISSELDIIEPAEQILSAIMRFPDVFTNESNDIKDEEWNALLKTIYSAISEFDKFRLQEGKALEDDILQRISIIQNLTAQIDKFESQRIELIKQRLQQLFNDFVNTSDIDRNRFEQELVYYLEKLDITEEKVRLNNHCKYFIDEAQFDSDAGKKLGFISQEIGREINTIGSKANNSEIQKIVVQMKDELEKIKEQLNNVL